jgi:zinc protease
LGQAYTLSASYVPGLDAGMIYLYVLTTDENVDAVQEVIFKELKDLTVNPVTAEELADSQAYINGRFQMGHETLSALGFAATLDELYGLGYDHVERYPQLISAVTPDDIMRAARSYFIPEQSVVVVTRPQSASQKK